MPLVNTVRNDDQTYGPTSRNHYYISKLDHRKTSSINKNKNRWNIQEGQEYEVFRITNEPYWFCDENNCLFSIIDDGKMKLGKNGERIAKFPFPENENDPWHGYPVNCAQIQNTPCDILLDRLEELQIISATTKKRIEKGKL